MEKNKDFKISFLTNEASSNEDAMMCDWRTGICGPADQMEKGKFKREGLEEEMSNDGHK